MQFNTLLLQNILKKFIEVYEIEDDDQKAILNKLDENKLMGLNFYYPLINSEKLFYVQDNFYYYEFFANIFLVLIVSTPTVFFYTHEALKLSFTHSFYLTSVIFFTLIICLYSARDTFKVWKSINRDIILGSLVEKAMSKNSTDKYENQQSGK